SDSFSTVDLGKYYAIVNTSGGGSVDRYLKSVKGKKVPLGFSYNSKENRVFLGVNEIRDLIRRHLDKKFSPF
ncbi:MAG: UDP-N-acetylglucosamine 4,6-dehydratase (inverting), partial [Flavobacteriia bacterium]|nr:UDP-N-acetylglucosamine 4,6-dehydratase (inverting) [Flavobacteriia bacterium]